MSQGTQSLPQPPDYLEDEGNEYFKSLVGRLPPGSNLNDDRLGLLARAWEIYSRSQITIDSINTGMIADESRVCLIAAKLSRDAFRQICRLSKELGLWDVPPSAGEPARADR